MSIAFPNESREYREARDALLQREVDLQRQMEAATAQRRSLPPGGEVPEDYVFDRIGDDGAATTVRMSELFGDSDTLMLYHYMFPRHSEDDRPRPTSGIFSELPTDEGPCPSCTALIDMWDGTMAHFGDLGGNLVIVAKAPIERVAAFAQDRGWRHARVLSAANCNFRRDYGGDGADGQPVPLLTVFKLWPDGTIRLHWASELMFAPTDDPGQAPPGTPTQWSRSGHCSIWPQRPGSGDGEFDTCPRTGDDADSRRLRVRGVSPGPDRPASESAAIASSG